MKKLISLWITIVVILFQVQVSEACTGITLTTKDNSMILARTIEWGGSDLNSQYVVVPRGYEQYSYIPGGKLSGMKFTARYGYIGLSVEQKEFVAEGLNEAGLSAGLFYFPKYGEYEKYEASKRDISISDLQLVSWLLGECASVDDIKEAISKVRIISLDPQISTVHWRFADISGRQLVLEIIGGEPRFYENTLGVLTNSPGFDWQLTNLNNYVNLFPGAAPGQSLGVLRLSPFGSGSGFPGGVHGGRSGGFLAHRIRACNPDRLRVRRVRPGKRRHGLDQDQQGQGGGGRRNERERHPAAPGGTARGHRRTTGRGPVRRYKQT